MGHHGAKRILVVEDEPLLAEAVAAGLPSARLRVVHPSCAARIADRVQDWDAHSAPVRADRGPVAA